MPGPAVRDLPSPNQDDRPAGVPVDMLILHYTGMQSAEAALDRLRDPAAAVSSHYVVEEDGAIWRLVPEGRRAFHAGVSSWRGHSALNGRCVGIEIVNPGHEWGYRPFPACRWRRCATADLSPPALGSAAQTTSSEVPAGAGSHPPVELVEPVLTTELQVSGT